MSAPAMSRGYSTQGTCPTGKKRFGSEELAETARQTAVQQWLEADRESATGRPLPMNVHGPCDRCRGWHWTTKAGKKWAAGKGGRKNPRRRGRR